MVIFLNCVNTKMSWKMADGDKNAIRHRSTFCFLLLFCGRFSSQIHFSEFDHNVRFVFVSFSKNGFGNKLYEHFSLLERRREQAWRQGVGDFPLCTSKEKPFHPVTTETPHVIKLLVSGPGLFLLPSCWLKVNTTALNHLFLKFS